MLNEFMTHLCPEVDGEVNYVSIYFMQSLLYTETINVLEEIAHGIFSCRALL